MDVVTARKINVDGCVGMEDMNEEKILVMFPESRRFAVEDVIKIPDENASMEDDIIGQMLADIPGSAHLEEDEEEDKEDGPFLKASKNKEEFDGMASFLSKSYGEAELDVQLEGVAEALKRLRYYLHEIEQFLPDKNRSKR